MGIAHALILPFPAQGHVIPLMELSHCLADRGFQITFVNTEYDHGRIVAALRKHELESDRVRHVSVPDGLAPDEDRNNLGRLVEGLHKSMPTSLEEVIRKSNENSGGSKITCMIVDQGMAWALEIAEKLGVRCVVFWPMCAALLALTMSTPKLIDDGIIDEEGFPKGPSTFQLSDGMPLMETARLLWNVNAGDEAQKLIFHYMNANSRATKKAEFILCNSFQELESPTFNYAPYVLPIGPLLTGLRLGKPVGHFWSEDTTCMSWLDEQPKNSVIYVAFGSLTIFDQNQFRELALGLETSGRPFLWVVRPDLTEKTSDAYPSGFKDRLGGRGRIVSWSPQQEVLAHPSLACFISHCGWNSTMEGVRNGVPFLCWPYFADQFANQTYICDVWRVGLKMVPGESGIITSAHISSRLEELLGDDGIMARARTLKEMANRSMEKEGSSFKNLNTFVEAMKTMGIPHALILPFPAQGHVIPLMELSHCLADQGVEITFVNTEFDHGRIVAALGKHELESDRVRHVSVPDGLAPDEDRNNLGRLVEGLHKSMPASLEEVIRKNNENCGGNKITCVIVDHNMAWALEIAEKLGVCCVVFWPMCAAILALIMSTPKLIDDGIIDEEGFPKSQSTFQLSDGMPLMETARLPWNVNAGDEAQKLIFHYMNANCRATKKAEFILCNSFQELESPTFNYAPYVLPIGPLLTGLQLGKPVGHFWSEDTTCMSWLDEQPKNSVIYVAFGSLTIFDQN
ncbi:UDP-glycosyltransferase 83A1, partial [Ananas comosus]